MKTYKESIEYATMIHDMYHIQKRKYEEIAKELDINVSKVSSEMKKFDTDKIRRENELFSYIIQHCENMSVMTVNSIILSLCRYFCSTGANRNDQSDITKNKFLMLTKDQIMNIRGIGIQKCNILLDIQNSMKSR